MLKQLGEKVSRREMTWAEATKEYNLYHKTNLTSNAVRKRYYVIRDKGVAEHETPIRESLKHNKDGTLEAEKIVNLPKEVKENPRLVLKAMGYNPSEWEIMSLQISNWQQHTREQSTKELYAVKVKLRPTRDLDKEKVYEIIDKAIIEHITPYELDETVERLDLDKSKSLLLPAVELHLGKEARVFDVGENYNVEIAKQRYDEIIYTTMLEQEKWNAHKLIYGIGNDFLNVDTPANTTTKGTQQLGGISSYELFDIGLKLQLRSLLALREMFNEIEVVLVKGNHANQTEYMLYRALEQRFANDDTIKFRSDYKDIQAVKMGNTSIFMTHGDVNYKRTIESMSNEFHKIYGDTEHRYILLGHLHHKQKIDELNGFTVFRLSSPSGIDRWHYKNRYYGKAGQEIFVFDHKSGLENIRYMNFGKSR